MGIAYNYEEHNERINLENLTNLSKIWKEYSGELFAGKWNGVGQITFFNGSTFYGNFLGGSAHGLGVFENKGEIITGFWQQNYLYKYL